MSTCRLLCIPLRRLGSIRRLCFGACVLCDRWSLIPLLRSSCSRLLGAVGRRDRRRGDRCSRRRGRWFFGDGGKDLLRCLRAERFLQQLPGRWRATKTLLSCIIMVLLLSKSGGRIRQRSRVLLHSRDVSNAKIYHHEMEVCRHPQTVPTCLSL